MKKTILITAIAASIISGAALTSCESKEKKVEDAQTKVEDAKQDLKDAKDDRQAELNAEYPAYKSDAEARINANQKQIDDLRAKLAKSGGTKPLDPARQKRIDDLEKRNGDLRARLYGYEKERGDWETFKREFNHDMDEVSDAFKDLGKDNVK